MKCAGLVVVAMAVLGTLGAGSVHAHGGRWNRGPEDHLGDWDPKDPKPPPLVPGTPDPNDFPSPPSPPPWPDPPGMGAPPARPPFPAGGVAANPISFESWSFWWRFNRDDILNRKDRRIPDDRRIDRQVVQTAIAPALRRVIANAALPPKLRATALIALARVRPADLDPGEFLRYCVPAGEEPALLRSAAILGLGIAPCRGPAVRDRLLALVRRQSGDRDQPVLERSFATLALGLHRDDSPQVWNALTAELDGNNLWIDTPVCVFLAMGLIGDETGGPDLLGWATAGRIGRYRQSDLEVAWMIDALGRLNDPRAAPGIARLLRRNARYTTRSAALALGRIVPGLGPAEQGDHVRILDRVQATSRDRMTRNFATMALGRIAASPRTFAPVRRAAIDALTRAFREGSKFRDRPFAALALGLAGRADIASSRSLADLIRPEFRSLRGDTDALGALAVSLGMLRDAESFDRLRRVLADSSHDVRLRRFAAVALGLIGDSRAIPGVLAALRQARDRDFIIDAATSAHLLGSRKAVDSLLDVISVRRNTQHHVGSALRALAAVGDRRAVGPLLAIVDGGGAEHGYPIDLRTLAVAALGRMADPRRHPALFRISRDMNYRATVPSLDVLFAVE